MKILKTLLLFLLFFTSVQLVYSAQCTDNIPSTAGDLNSYIADCQNKLNSLKNEKQTLQAAILTLDSKIRLTLAQITLTTKEISQLEKDIATLSVVVSDLNTQLDKLSSVYVSRVVESYKRRDPNPLVLFASSDSLTNYLSKKKYLSIIKSRDRLILGEMTSAKQDYDAQKEAKIIKQKQIKDLKDKLVIQQQDLSSQQKSKKDLLIITANSETKYQSLLSQAKAELEAINAIVAGKGQEQFIKEINKGDAIASIIQGSSCNSSGTHLHLTISDKSIVQNPFNYLKTIDYLNYSGGDSFSPSGSWDWPIDGPISFNQGYGETWAVRNTWAGNVYRFHNGIDISGSSPTVRALQSGGLYRGSYTGSNGCALKYVRIDHKDTDIDSFYLHINYN